MLANIGQIDRAVRLVLGLVLFSAPLLNVPAIWSDPLLSKGAVIVGIILALTSIFRFCPLYRIFGLSTGDTQ